MTKLLSFLLFAVCGTMGCATDTTEADTAALSGYDTAATGSGGHHGPPQAAIDACAAAASGDACTFTLDTTTLTGLCLTRPAHPGGGHHGGGEHGGGSGTPPPPPPDAGSGSDAATLVCVPPPPQALIDACSGLAVDAACTFTSPRDGADETGTCQTSPVGNVVACRPSRGPHAPPPDAGSGSGV